MEDEMRFETDVNQQEIHDRLRALAAAPGVAPDLSVVVPVNAQGDLQNVLRLLCDVSTYRGPATLEVILVVNNFPPEMPPPEVNTLPSLGVRVVAIPNVRRAGEAVGFSARIPGIRAAASEYVVLFDADCRVVDATALLNWYAQVFRGGARAAYTHVAFYDFENSLSIRTRHRIHHGARWIKRNVFRIPTTRGSNYAVSRTPMLEMYEEGLLADEMNVGPAFARRKGPVAYSGRRQLMVYTSGRMARRGWLRIPRYFFYRLRYNFRVLRAGAGVAKVTGRENDPVRRYINNRPVRD
jgi:hypothetical protein